LQTKTVQLQCVYAPAFSQFGLHELKCNMAVVIQGEVIKEERSRSGYEVRIIDFEPPSCPVEEPPVVINNKEIVTSLESLLDYRPITLRNAKERTIFKIQSGICEGFRAFLQKNKFTEIHSPKIVSGGAEGGANIFPIDYFGKQAYLCQSPQFYKQIMVGVFERVYEIAPVFRAEKHDTSRHINEYTSVDLEVGFINSFYDLIKLETAMLSETFAYLKAHYQNELSLLQVSIPEIREIPAVKFMEAKEMLAKAYNRKITDWEDFEPEEEKLLCELIKKQTGSELVFVTHYKSSKRPFYTMESRENPEFTESFDLLFRGMEITTGGQRIHSYTEQVAKMERLGMNIDAFSSYLMAHKYGLPPHGGMGIGLERLTAKLLGFENVRRATLFPRDINRLEP
jgi:nondiscriminating aspartyl-tRNA synthetase